MEGTDEILEVLGLFANVFFSVIIPIVSVAAAVFVRNRVVSCIIALVTGAILGLVGTTFELLDVYLTKEGWGAFSEVDAIVVLLAMLAAFAWWTIARFLHALTRKRRRLPVPHQNL